MSHILAFEDINLVQQLKVFVREYYQGKFVDAMLDLFPDLISNEQQVQLGALISIR